MTFSNCGFDWNSLEAEPLYIDMKHAKYLEFHFWAHGRSSPAPDHTNAPTVPMPLLDQKNISIKGMLKNIPSLKLTCPLKIQLPERKGSYSNLLFSAALAASFRGTHFFTVMCPTHLNRYLLVCCTGITSDGWKPNITTFSVQKKPQTMPWLGHGTYHSGFWTNSWHYGHHGHHGCYFDFCTENGHVCHHHVTMSFFAGNLYAFYLFIQKFWGPCEKSCLGVPALKGMTSLSIPFRRDVFTVPFSTSFCYPKSIWYIKKTDQKVSLSGNVPQIHTMHQKTDGE